MWKLLKSIFFKDKSSKKISKETTNTNTKCIMCDQPAVVAGYCNSHLELWVQQQDSMH